MELRLLVVAALLVAFVASPPLYRWRQRRLQIVPPNHPLVPLALRDGSTRTWVLFTTPWCASCGPVEERLRTFDPDARVVTVDATREAELAGAFAVRSAPTAVLADNAGRVQVRLIGPQAVDEYVAARASDISAP